METAGGRGGARPRVGRNLDGRMHLMGGGVVGSCPLTPSPPPEQAPGEGGEWNWPPCGPPDWAGGRGQASPLAPLQHVSPGRPQGTPLPGWQPVGGWIAACAAMTKRCGGVGQGVGSGRGVGQDLLAQPVRAGRRGHGGDGCGTRTKMTWHGGRSGRCCVISRCARGGTQTVMARHSRRNGEGPAMTRCPKGGTLTVLTRRPR